MLVVPNNVILATSERRSIQQVRSSVLLDLAGDADALAQLKPQRRQIPESEIIAAYRTLNDLLYGYPEADDHSDHIAWEARMRSGADH